MQFDIQTHKKYQVDLSDYDFQSDLFSRKILSNLKPSHTLHLIELFYLSSKTTWAKLKNSLDLTDQELQEFVDAIAPLKILVQEGENVLIDKDAKKKVECFLEKFSEEFSPGIEYFQSLLKQVPITILPNWYSLPRSCESIFLSLKERIFHAPNLYLRHLLEIESDFFEVQPVIQALLNAHTLAIEEVLELSKACATRLEEICLFLEFNFAAVLCYEDRDDQWVPTLKLPEELSAYLKQKSISPPFTAIPQSQVKPDRGIPLTFAFDLSQILRQAKVTPLKANDAMSLQKLENILLCSQEHIQRVIERGLHLQLLSIEQGFLSLCAQAEPWLLYSIEKQALTLYKALWIQGKQGGKQAEKALCPLINKGWVLLTEVLDFCSHGKRTLQRGKEGYVYDCSDEVRLTKEILDTLFESGIIEWGSFEDQLCLRLTDLGEQITS